MRRSLALLLSLNLVGLAAHADDTKNTGTEPPGEIQSLIADLDSEKYATRDQASRKLATLGEAAIEPLSAAAESGSREVSTRALGAIELLAKSQMPSAKAKAMSALEKLAKCSNDSVARRAEQILRPADVLVPGAVVPGLGGRRNFGRGAQIRFNVGGRIRIGGGGNLRVRVVQNNNRRAVDVEENGRKIHIEEDERGIDVVLTEKVGDQQKVTAFGRKKNLAELKKAEPEAAKLYEKYVGGMIPGGMVLPGGGNVRIQVQAGQGIQIQAQPQPAVPAEKPQAPPELPPVADPDA